MRIERHVENRGGPTGGSGARPRFESLPICSSRFVEVDMRINHSGKNRSLVAIDFFTRRSAQVRPERNEFSFRDSDVAIVSAHDQIEITHSLGRTGTPHDPQTAHSAVRINVQPEVSAAVDRGESSRSKKWRVSACNFVLGKISCQSSLAVR